MSSSASQVSEQSSLSPEIKALRRNGPLNIRHATNPHLQPTLKRIFIELVKDYIPSGGFHRNSPVQAAYNFRLVCQAFHDASVPQFDETFFKVRQGTVGTESLQTLVDISNSRFNEQVKVLVLNLFPTDWKPNGVDDSNWGKTKLARAVATFWDESKYFDWLCDTVARDAFIQMRDTLIEIFCKLPNLEKVCISAYSFNEFFCCSRRNYLAVAAHQAGFNTYPLEGYRVSHTLLAKDQIGYHQLLGTWSKCLEACYAAFQYTDTLNLQHLKLRLPEEMFRYGNPPFPRDVFKHHSLHSPPNKDGRQSWFADLEAVTISVIMSEPSVPHQMDSFEQTSDRWVSRLLYGMSNLKEFTLRSTNTEVIRNNHRNGHFDRAMILFRTPTLEATGIEPDHANIYPFNETPPWTWPTLPLLTKLTICNIQASYGGAVTFLKLNKDTLKTLHFDGHSHIYSDYENQSWYNFIVEAGIICSSLEVQLTEQTTLSSWMWMKDTWRSIETYVPTNDSAETINAPRRSNWPECWKTIKKTIVHRDTLLSDVDYHERLPAQFNPFHLKPQYEL